MAALFSKTKVSFLITCIGLVFAYFAAGCGTVPLTGRKQLALIPESQIIYLSDTSYSELMANSKLSTDKEKIDMLNRVGKRIITATENFLRESGLESELQYYNW